jgi:hypothetical protein
MILLVNEIIYDLDDEWMRKFLHQFDLFQYILLLLFIKKTYVIFRNFYSEYLLIMFPYGSENIAESATSDQIIFFFSDCNDKPLRP